VDGGIPGHSGTSVKVGPDGTKYVAACKGHRLQVYVQTPGATDWQVRVVDEFAEGPALAVDPDGHLHLAYHDLWHNRPKYANDVTGQWVKTTVDTIAQTGKNAAIALDQNGAVHISYMAEATLDVRYTTNMTGSWAAETIWSLGDVGKCTSIALDHSGYVFIAFGNPDQSTFSWSTRVMSNRTGSWKTEFNIPNGNCASVAVDSNGAVHVAFDLVTFALSTINYATDAGSGWTYENVTGNTAGDPVLALDDQGKAHIAYQDPGNGIDYWLKYASNENGNWADEIIYQGNGTLPENQSIAWWDNSLFVSSYVYTDLSLYYSMKDLKVNQLSGNSISTLASSQWSTQPVDLGAAGWQSIVVDDNSEIHLFYASSKTATETSLVYAHKHLGVWEKYSIDVLGSATPAQKSLIIDHNGFAHLTYYDPVAHQSQYGTNESGSWFITSINIAGIFDLQASEIGIDNTGLIHILSYDSATNLFHLKKESNVWNSELIATGVDKASFTLDKFDNVHSCYGSNIDGHLHYITSLYGSWSDLVVDNGTDIIFGCAITTDQDGNPLISYVDKSDYHLKYARIVQGIWSIMDFDNPTISAIYTDITVDFAGKTTIAFGTWGQSGLWVTSDQTGQWISTLLDPNGTIGGIPSLVSDPAGKNWIAYSADLAVYYTKLGP